jgi:hypothetical protein
MNEEVMACWSNGEMEYWNKKGQRAGSGQGHPLDLQGGGFDRSFLLTTFSRRRGT